MDHSIASSSSNDDEAFDTRIMESVVDLPENLDPCTKHAFCVYAATILRLDFGDNWDHAFCSSTLELLATHFQFENSPKNDPKNVDRKPTGILEYFKPDGRHVTDDIVPFIEAIKADPFVVKNGVLTVLADLVAVFVKTGCYDSRFRVLLRHMCALLAVPWDDVERCEQSVVHLLEQQEGSEESGADIDRRQKAEKRKKIKRYLMIGAGSAVGGVLVGLTGGLAAPIFAGGVAMLAGSAAAAGIATTAGAAILGSVCGVAGAGLAGYKMQRRVGAVEEFVVETLSDGRSLHLALCVSGWISEERDDSFRWAWRNVTVSQEQYCLRYESKYLLQLGQAVEYLMSFAVSYAIEQTLMETALAGLVTALAWPLSIITAGSMVDNPWNVGVRRAAEVGDHLAQILMTRRHGRRPVTLMGFSLGARVIYRCLQEMARRGDEALGMIDDVILLGAPVTGSPQEWLKISQIVAGRIVNGYSSTDWMLKFLYRTMNAQFTIAGTAPINTGCSKVVNVNLTHIVRGHNDYQHKLTEILKAVGIRVKDIDVSAKTSPSSSFTNFNEKTLEKNGQNSLKPNQRENSDLKPLIAE